MDTATQTLTPRNVMVVWIAQSAMLKLLSAPPGCLTVIITFSNYILLRFTVILRRIKSEFSAPPLLPAGLSVGFLFRF